MGFRDYSPGLNRFLTRDTYNGALADLHLGADPYTGNRYALAGGNPITGIELDGHLSGAACGPDGITCGMTDMGSSAGYTPLPAPAPTAAQEPQRNAFERFVHNTGEFVGGAKDGAVEAGKGLGQLGYDVFYGSSPFADEQTRAETRARAHARKHAVTHPKQLAEAIIAPYQHDLATGRNAHAAGRAVFDLITIIGAGSLTKTGKAATAANTVAVKSGQALNAAARAKVPASWGAGSPTAKGTGTRWFDPQNPSGSGVRIDQGNPASKWPTQQVDHVIVRRNGVVVGRDGRPISGSIKDNPVEAHIPLSEWLTWSEWWRP
jgi:hypothetical protein